MRSNRRRSILAASRRSASEAGPPTATSMTGQFMALSWTIVSSASAGRVVILSIADSTSWAASVMLSTYSSNSMMTTESPSVVVERISLTSSTSATAFSIGTVTSSSSSAGETPK